jgi:serine/threonine protein kinase
MQKKKAIDRFRLPPGTILAEKYEILGRLGRGWEGEVFDVRELKTGVERAAKLFYPQRNRGNRAVRFHARKLHKLRHCSVLIQYHTQETIDYRGQQVTLLVSELVEGERLSHFTNANSGKRLSPFEGLHLLHALSAGLEQIHDAGEYHGDLHDENILVRKKGLGFEIKLLDPQNLGPSAAGSRREDVCDLIRIFYDLLGGQRLYAAHPPEIKQICCGLKRTLIFKKFRSGGQLRKHLEQMSWE